MGKRPIDQGGRSIDPKLFPNVNTFTHRLLLENPPMCSLKELQDGTYSIDDVLLMNELLDLKLHLSKPKASK